jgi:hypothetical protein
MSSQRQIEANRRNAQKSTGPKTEAGKDACRFNAVQHGFTAQRFVVDHEDESEFDAFRDDFFAEHAPATATETFLVEQMVAAAWRIRRIRNVEAAFWDLKMADCKREVKSEYSKVQDSDYLAYAIQGEFYRDSAINNLARYEARLERAFYKALHELERLRVGQTPRSAAGPQTRPSPQIGSVSPKPQIVPRPEPPEPSFQAARNDYSLVGNRTPVKSSNLTS